MKTNEEIWRGTIVPVYPTMPHLMWLGSDLDLKRVNGTYLTPNLSPVLSPFIAEDIVDDCYLEVEEQLDGTCLAIYLDDFGKVRVKLKNQVISPSRSSDYLGPLWDWVKAREKVLESVLFPDRVIYGEWCYTTHIVKYTKLPDFFFGFDVYELDRGRFWDLGERDELLRAAQIKSPNFVVSGYFATPEELSVYLGDSAYRDGGMKGMIVRATSRRDADEERSIYAVRHPRFATVSASEMKPPYERNELVK